MTKLQYTGQQLSDLRHALYYEGVHLPADIFAISSGSFGIAVISTNQVLKLFKTNSPGNRTAAEQVYYRQANQALRNVAEIESQLNGRGIEVPKLLDCKEFSETLQIGAERIHAAQLMTRLDGHGFIKMLESLHPVNLAAEAADTIELAKCAARVHVQMGAAGKQISNGIYTRGKAFDLNTQIAWDESSHQLLDRLRNDIAANSTPQDKVTLLHGDFHPGNILQSSKGFSIFDWDQQMYGRPEMDVRGFMALRPQYMQQYCEAYNSIATQPLNENLVVAYGLIAAARNYSQHLKDSAGNNMNSGTQMPDLTASGYQLQIHELAQRMHQLTGHGAYAETAHSFSTLYEMGGMSLNPSTPQLRLGGPQFEAG